MNRRCIIDLPGLSRLLIDRLDADQRPAWFNALIEQGCATVRPVLPAVTLPAQASVSTGTLPREHGIIANGLPGFREPDMVEHFDLSSFAEHRRKVSFWEQSNHLLQADRVWKDQPGQGAMLFVQSSMYGAAPIICTPKPEHTTDGRTISLCHSQPDDLYPQLQEKLGPFPLHKFWGPLSGIEASQWIITAATHVWSDPAPDWMWLYVPHMDYDQQRYGPHDERITQGLQQILEHLTPLVTYVQDHGGEVALFSEYGMTEVQHPVFPNRQLHDAGLLASTVAGEIDWPNSKAFAMCDHQVAHVYLLDADAEDAVQSQIDHLCEQGHIAEVYSGVDRGILGLDHRRSGDWILFADTDAWFAYPWWTDFEQAPPWAWTVDIHRKPGYDPTDLFVDMERKRIRADEPHLVRGSHGALPDDSAYWPVVLGRPDMNHTIIEMPELARLWT